MVRVSALGSVLTLCILAVAGAIAQEGPPPERRSRPAVDRPPQQAPEGRPEARRPADRPQEEARPDDRRPAEGPGGRRPGAPPEPPPAMPIRLDLTVHQVELTAEQLLQVDAEVLALRSRTPLELHAALADLGPTELLYRVDQSLNLVPGARSESITVATDLPYLMAAAGGKDGQRVGQINRQKSGLRLHITAPGGPGAPPHGVVMAVDMSVMANSDLKLADELFVPVFRSIEVSEVFAPLGRPCVSLSIDAVPGRPDGKALAYVTRIVATPLGGPPGLPPQPGVGEPPARDRDDGRRANPRRPL